MTPTPEQAAIVDAAVGSADNLLVMALAGAAKTSTLVLIAEALPKTEMLCLSFNKKIAMEMTERLPSNCKAMTLNSLGHRVWMDATGRRLRIEAGKTGDILKSLVDDLPREDKRAAYDNFGELIRTIDFGKACGYVPEGKFPRAKALMDDEEFFAHLDYELTPLEVDLVQMATTLSIRQAFEGLCDFGDQVFMPTIFHGAFPRYPLVLVDEAQDLSALNHATLRKLAKKRLIAVGDPCQAIYGFRGAHEDSMSKLGQDFSMTELALTVSFRCPTSIVEHARWRAPMMKWPEWAKPGEVRHLHQWSHQDLPDQAVIICRNNAPLFSCAIKLLQQGRPIELAKNDIGKALLRVMKKFGDSKMPTALLRQKITEWEEAQIKKAKKRGEGSIHDRAACMRVFAMQGENLGDALAYAEHLFASRGPVKLMTGHGSKGLEFNEVFFLDEFLVGDEGQEQNLRYVIITRAKQRLTYVRSENFHVE